MNELQQTELDILKATVDVIEQLGLRYYAVCGTALGAVKYGGFIPWDDDVDIALPREDYSVFCEKAQSLLPKYLFLQNHHTDPDYPLMFAKIRDSRTTFIETSIAKRKINHGVYIDVFPLDGYPTEKEDIEKFEKAKYRFKLISLSCFKLKQSARVEALLCAMRFFRVHKRMVKRIDRFEKEMTRWGTEDSELWCNHGNWQGKREYAPKEQYGDGVFADFEGIKLRVPEKYDDYFTQKYGDWRSEPPEEMKKAHHYCDVCDCKQPYTEYIKK